MKIYRNLILALLLIVGFNVGNAKNFIISEIIDLPADRSATDSSVLDVNGQQCALIKLPFPKVDETVISGDQIFKKEYHGNEWYIYMPPETFKFYIKYPGYDDLEVDLSKKFSKGVESGKTYKVTIPYDASEITPIETLQPISQSSAPLVSQSPNHSSSSMHFSTGLTHSKESLIKKNCLYLQVGYNAIGLSGVNVGIGGFISNFNVEANYIIGLSKSDEIYWNDPSGDKMPISARYTPSSMNFKLGYGIKIGERFRLTPRTGIQYVVLKEKADKKVANNANAVNLPLGVKLDFAIVNHFGISLEPSYTVNLTQTEGYKALANISSKVKGYADGFGLNISLFCNF